MPAVPGDYIRQGNNEGGEVLTTTPTTLAFATAIDSNGSSITYSAGVFTLAKGIYFITYSDFWQADAGDPDEVEIQCRLYVDTVETLYGAASCHFYNSGNDKNSYLSGGCILKVDADDTDLEFKFFQTDSGNATVDRGNDSGMVAIIALPGEDTDHAYGFYEITGDEAAVDSWGDIPWDTTVSEDTGISRTGALITLTTAARYLVCYSIPMNTTGTADPTEYHSRITLDDAEPNGVRVSCVMGYGGGCQDEVLSFQGVIDVAANDVLAIESLQNDGTSTDVYKDGSNIQIWRLPSGTDAFKLYTAGEDIQSGAELAWDASDFKDSGSFSHTNKATDLNIDQAGDYLFFACIQADDWKESLGIAGGWWFIDGAVEATTLNAGTYAGGSDEGDDGLACDNGGFACGRFFPGLTASNYISWETWQGNTSMGGTIAADHASMSGFNLDEALTYTLSVSVAQATIQFSTAAPVVDITTSDNVDIPIPDATLEIVTAAPFVEAPISASPGAATIEFSTAAPTLDIPLTIPVGPAEVQISTAAPTVGLEYLGIPASAEIQIVSEAPFVEAAIDVLPGPATLEVTTAAPTIGLEYVGIPASAEIQITSVAPFVEAAITLFPGSATIEFSTAAPTLDIPLVIPISQATIEFATEAPVVDASWTITIPDATLEITTVAPVVDISELGAVDIPIPSCEIQIATVAPVVDISDDYLLVKPGSAEVQITTAAPTLDIPLQIPISQATIQFATEAPFVEAAITVSPGQAILEITSVAPFVEAPIDALPGQAILQISTAAPVVQTGLLIPISQATIQFATEAPFVEAEIGVSIGQATIQFATEAPVVDITEPSVTVEIPPATIVFATEAPFVEAAIDVLPGAATITVATAAPTVGITARVEIGAAEIIFATVAPYVQVPVDVTVEIGQAVIILAASAPVIVLGPALVSISQATIIAEGHAPFVEAEITLEPGAATITATTAAPDITYGPAIVSIPQATIVLTSVAPVCDISDDYTLVKPGSAEILIDAYAPYVGLPTTIDGAYSQVLSSQYEVCILYSDGTKWWLEHKGAP